MLYIIMIQTRYIHWCNQDRSLETFEKPTGTARHLKKNQNKEES